MAGGGQGGEMEMRVSKRHLRDLKRREDARAWAIEKYGPPRPWWKRILSIVLRRRGSGPARP